LLRGFLPLSALSGFVFSAIVPNGASPFVQRAIVSMPFLFNGTIPIAFWVYFITFFLAYFSGKDRIDLVCVQNNVFRFIIIFSFLLLGVVTY
jgi:hypothetical protein